MCFTDFSCAPRAAQQREGIEGTLALDTNQKTLCTRASNLTTDTCHTILGLHFEVTTELHKLRECER